MPQCEGSNMRGYYLAYKRQRGKGSHEERISNLRFQISNCCGPGILVFFRVTNYESQITDLLKFET